MTEKDFLRFVEKISNDHLPDYEICASNYIGVKEEDDPNMFHVIVGRIFPKEMVDMLYLDISEKDADQLKTKINDWIEEITTELVFC